MRSFVVAAILLVSGSVVSGAEAQSASHSLRADSRSTSRAVPPRVERGRLARGDDLLDSGEFADTFTFEGRGNQRVSLNVLSDDFDTYLLLIPPGGNQEENDDIDDDSTNSALRADLTETGTYQVVVTSFEKGETGSYELRIMFEGQDRAPSALRRNAGDAATSSRMSGTRRDPRSAGRTFGIFVGISEYPDPDDNLDYTADDARRMHQALVRGAGMRAADGVVLVDRGATRANVRRAFENMSRQVGPDDTFVFFFSGHGDRVRRNGQQATDPDGFDETIDFYDDSITDDEMRDWFNAIDAGVSLVVLDSCFSGGFSKDVIAAPGRMGLFSSEEDVISNVADKFRAGGYLAKFIAEAVGDRRADDDGDGSITAVELSQYLHERYRKDVKSSRPSDDNFVRSDQIGYQHLVVDRGGVGPHDVLFRH